MNKTIAILGAGESGVGAAILAQKQGLSAFVSDAGKIADAHQATLRSIGVDFEEGGHTTARILAVDEVVKSPGIPDSAPLVVALMQKRIPVISEIEFAFRYMDPQAKVVAITGTNGKTTTTLLTHHILKTAGLRVALGGNVGVSFASLVAEGNYDYYVIEVSSFQLDGIVQFRPDVAVLLNITPDHLDRYEYDFQKYVDAKFRITENLTKQECFIYSADSHPTTEEISKRKISACMFALSAASTHTQAHLDQGHLKFKYTYKDHDVDHSIPVAEVALIGKHNMLNTMAAVLTALNFAISIEHILKGLKTFINAPHRLELCGEVGQVRYINDSKATNVDSVYYALESIEQPIVWIAGGIDKGNDYSQIKSLVEDRVKAIVCLGTNNEPLLKFFGDKVNVIRETNNMTGALEEARMLATAGDVVLLAPACASFDLFRNYEDRGNQFRDVVKQLIKTKSVSA